MHQIRFRLGHCPISRWGAYSAPRGLLAGYKGATSKGREGRKDGREEKGEGREGDLLLRVLGGNGKEEREWEG